MTTTAANAEFPQAQPAAEERDVPLPLRGDTFLGVCEAIGQDLGFNPNWLRIPFAALILWNPVAIVAAYLGLGCVVAVSRWFFPVAKAAPASEAPAGARTGEIVAGNQEAEKELLAA